MITYVTITGFIGGFKEYSSIVGIFGDGMGPPGNKGALNTMVGFIYDHISNHQGRASAAALILFAIILVITRINLAISKRTTYY
jgi:multiple sugar transport system permease protein